MVKPEVNIKSSTVEKALDLVKDFLDKIIGPTAEELGLLAGDGVRFWRVRNQIRILQKAKTLVETYDIQIKEIPIKILVPLLENASLEGDETLQDKWANLIVNMVDSELNLQNHIFPYLLSQISIEEYNELKSLLEDEKTLHKEKEKLKDLETKDGGVDFHSYTTNKQRTKVDELKREGFSLNLEKFEAANLHRLGLVRQLPPRIFIEAFETGGRHWSESQWHDLEAIYDPDDYGYRITDLGVRFIEICELKKS